MTTKFNAEIKAEWVTALRSGKYAQGKEKLHNSLNDSFCCLGVLRDLHPEFKRRESYECEYLDSALCGIDFYTQERLAQLNDDDVPFAEIADFIEKEVSPCTT